MNWTDANSHFGAFTRNVQQDRRSGRGAPMEDWTDERAWSIVVGVSCRVPLSLMPSSDSAHHTSTQFRTRLIEIPPESRRSSDIRRSRHRSARVGGGEHCIPRTLCCMHVDIYFFFRHVVAAGQRLPRWPILHAQMFRKDNS